jgi:hypothetical protein
MSKKSTSSSNESDSVRSNDSEASSVESIRFDVSDLPADSDLEKLTKTNTTIVFDPQCVRKKSNWSKTAPEHKFDGLNFEPDILEQDIHSHSAKLESLLKRIEALDKRDMEKDGRLYKHFIFSDLKMGSYGARLIAAALISKGMTLGYKAARNTNPKSKKIFEKMELLEDTTLSKTKNNNFYLLSSVSVFDQPISVVMKKTILKKFNQRPENVYGELARIIIMDSGFKEGIDLFDIKYVHIYEPQSTMADQKQVIGRGTRTCGQKGLQFHPTKGWPLHVFIYDTSIPEELKSQMLDSNTLFELYMKSMNIDFRLFNFQHDLERATVFGSVDYELNRAIHSFSIQPDEDDMMLGGGPKRIKVNKDLPVLHLPAQIAEVVFPAKWTEPVIEQKDHAGFRELIREHFSQFAWKDVKMENNCVPKDSQKGGAELLNYTPTQDFVRHYFTPRMPIKGMLLWQSVGTGKTCSAIAAATSTFEKEGYTILWVTRTTLKNDIWKNMFDQVCNESIRDEIKAGVSIPDEQAKRMRMLSKSWSIRPMSYKQFSNLVSKQNSFYEALVKKNGEADPLHKTLLIIDEAHKLYGGDDLSSIERPDMNALSAAIQNSYLVSGQNSVRLLLMTATPITGNAMELIKLINLTKPMAEHMPDQFSDFSETYLDEDGRFTREGEKKYLDDIAGHVSYLNREKDARQFSQPIVRFVNTPLVDNVKETIELDKKAFREQVAEDIANIQVDIDENNKAIEGELSDINALRFGFLKEKCEPYDDKAKKKCEKLVRGHIKLLVDEAKTHVKDIKEKIKDLKRAIHEKKEFRRVHLNQLKNDTSVEALEKLDALKQTTYYAITHKCGKKVTTMKELDEVLKDHPTIAKYDNAVGELDEKIASLKRNIDIAVLAHKNRIKYIRSIIKQGVTTEEKNLLVSISKSENKTFSKQNKTANKEFTEEAKDINKEKKHTLKLKKKAISHIRKIIKKTVKNHRKEAKQLAKVEKDQEKMRRKQGVYLKEIQHDMLKGLVEKHSSHIDSGILKMKDELEELEEEAAEKKAEKLEKAEARRTMQLQKAQEREHKKTMKNQQKMAKEASKKEKEAEKEATKLEKQAEKLQKEAEKKQQSEQAKQTKMEAAAMAKRAKEAEKEAAKQEKIKQAATKKLLVEQKKLNKTMKKRDD